VINMKITLREFRHFVRALVESVCPVCGGDGAYIGLNDVECPNKACPKFSVKQLNAGEEESDEYEPNKLPGDYVHLDRYQMQQQFPDALEAWEEEWGPVPTGDEDGHEGVFQWSSDEQQLLAVPGEVPGIDEIKTWYGDRWA